MKPTLEELAAKLSEVLGRSVSGNHNKWNDTYEFHTREYGSNNSLNFGTLMKVGVALGTLDFDINTEFEKGHRYSEYTSDPDETIRTISVKVDKIGTGLPWDKEKQ